MWMPLSGNFDDIFSRYVSLYLPKIDSFASQNKSLFSTERFTLEHTLEIAMKFVKQHGLNKYANWEWNWISGIANRQQQAFKEADGRFFSLIFCSYLFMHLHNCCVVSLSLFGWFEYFLFLKWLSIIKTHKIISFFSTDARCLVFICLDYVPGVLFSPTQITHIGRQKLCICA